MNVWHRYAKHNNCSAVFCHFGSHKHSKLNRNRFRVNFIGFVQHSISIEVFGNECVPKWKSVWFYAIHIGCWIYKRSAIYWDFWFEIRFVFFFQNSFFSLSIRARWRWMIETKINSHECVWWENCITDSWTVYLKNSEKSVHIFMRHSIT